MLPIFRILPVGGVFLAIMLLVLALNAPDGSRAQLTPSVGRMRGAMIARSDHPEWRQFLMLAAIQRAEELNRLRELPDTPARTELAPAVPKVAGLPTERSDTDPEADDQTGSIVQPPAATIPIDIGETSSTELPMAAPEEQPPVIRTPQRVKSRNESRIKGVPRARRGRTPSKSESPATFNLFEPFFGEQKTKQQPKVGANTTIR
jgi:hypothetical protein